MHFEQIPFEQVLQAVEQNTSHVFVEVNEYPGLQIMQSTDELHSPQFEIHALQEVSDKKYPPEHVRQTVELEQLIQPNGHDGVQIPDMVNE
ncbi:hypothetical protein SteCoe_40636 [Stentor coeruleus]|uniref:Uncharacterized protein n=1 Tax=Stentor coeruleus TaxID=5963 RepID=A0A1R2AKJ8_9CILI|nr:hypothetical protein SteCoe_40636 [Stentor coeruleus]